MEFGFGLPTRGPMATPQSLATLARTGEELGFGIISVSDHVIIPKAINSTYPYNESGTFAGQSIGRVPGATVAPELPGRRHVLREAAHLGHGAATPSARAHGKNAGDHRRALQRPPHRRLRRGLDARGV